MAEERVGRFERRAWVLALAAVMLFALGLIWLGLHERRREADIGRPGNPVVFVLSPEHGSRLTPEQRGAMAAFLQAESGLAVEVRVAASPLEAVEAFGTRGRRGDIGLLKLFEYLLARGEYEVEARLQVLRAGESSSFCGEVLVRADGPIRSVRDLEGRSVAYVDPYSTSGFVFPAKLLADAGVRVKADFARSHAEALARLRAGQADAAATYAGAAAADPALRAVARTETIPNEPVFFRRGLDAGKKERLVEALRKLAATAEGCLLLRTVADTTGFRPIGDDHYLGVLAAIRAAGRTIVDVVPEGDRVESERRGIDYVP
ncbi:MAG: PhnD/SsuA/transferrin family substrate-binding protein [Planctomycetes bacterium]|nr:PhnD/SsuA/transferrin family substrate-binding protein [Planctomycetota bacterium]